MVYTWLSDLLFDEEHIFPFDTDEMTPQYSESKRTRFAAFYEYFIATHDPDPGTDTDQCHDTAVIDKLAYSLAHLFNDG